VPIQIPISTYENSVGANWYHPHVHEQTKPQVEGGLAGMIMVGNPLEPWPQYKDELKQVNMTISDGEHHPRWPVQSDDGH
jgi:FtsP/CotA-like multicopper oxidase with cupredoxin domain